MAVELLTVVTYPDNSSRCIAPERYFAELVVRHRIEVVKEKLHQLKQKADLFAITYWHRSSMSMALR